jgi:pimeloyl-ACP methyl ester carboxylesterase
MNRPGPVLLLLASLAACGGDAPAEPPVVTGEVPSADGVPIRYDVRGTREPTLVLVHGWTNSRAIWGEHPETLSRTNRVITLDLAGHGESGAGRTAWTVDAFGEDVASVVRVVAPDSVVLVGFSMGGAAVLEAAQRLSDRTLGVVLVDVFHDLDMSLTDGGAREMETTFRERWGDTTFLRAFAFTPDAPDSVISYAASLMPAEPREHWFAMLRPYAAWTRTELLPSIRSLSVPVAAINTTLMPTNLEDWLREVPSFTVDTLLGVGHAGILLQRVPDFDARLRAIVGRFRGGPTATSAAAP